MKVVKVDPYKTSFHSVKLCPLEFSQGSFCLIPIGFGIYFLLFYWDVHGPYSNWVITYNPYISRFNKSLKVGEINELTNY